MHRQLFKGHEVPGRLDAERHGQKGHVGTAPGRLLLESRKFGSVVVVVLCHIFE
jgi:hypothetical protein